MTSEQDDVHPDFSALGRLRLHLPVRTKEHPDVKGHQCEGDDGPTAAFHVFMAQRDEHGRTLSVGLEAKVDLIRV